MTRQQAFAAACGALVVGTLLALGGTTAFSDGKADAARSGCGPETGCHGVAGQQGPLVMAALEGLPDAYTPGGSYPLAVRVEGAPAPLPVASSQGGFALEASAGTLLAVDDAVQIEAGAATHTAAGNDRRSWDVVWVAPFNATGDVTFYLSVNAVNGNGAPDPADLWTSATLTVPPAAGLVEAPAGDAGGDGNATAPPPQEPARTPGPGGLAAAILGAVAALALAGARRR